MGLMKGAAEVLLSSDGQRIWNLNVGGTIETQPIELSHSSYFSIFYKIGNYSGTETATIKIAKGFKMGNDFIWTPFEDLQPNAVNNISTGDWQHTEFAIPFCTYIKFELSGTWTKRYMVLALARQ